MHFPLENKAASAINEQAESSANCFPALTETSTLGGAWNG